MLGRVSRSGDRQMIRHGELAVELPSREVTVAGISLDLSAKECQLLTTLAAEPERVFTKGCGVEGGATLGVSRSRESCLDRRVGTRRVLRVAGV